MKTKYILKRVLIAIPTFFGITILAYIISSMAPGSPLDMLLADPRMTAEEIARREVALGLDKPVIVQYFTWLSQFLQGNLGFSYRTGRQVFTMIGERPPFASHLFLHDPQHSGRRAIGYSGSQTALFRLGLYCFRPVVSNGRHAQLFCRANFHLSICSSMEHSSNGWHV